MIPEIKAGQVLPPTLYVMVARLRLRDNPETIISESRMEFGVPQILKYSWQGPTDFVLDNTYKTYINELGVIAVAMPAIPDKAVFKGLVHDKIREFWADAGPLNIRLVFDNRPIQGPYKHIAFRGRSSLPLPKGGRFGFKQGRGVPDRNEDPGYNIGVDHRFGYVEVDNIIGLFHNEELFVSPNNPRLKTFLRPYSINEMVYVMARTGVHESGHLFGLVNRKQYGNATPDFHNNLNTPEGFIMNSGEEEPYSYRIGRSGEAKWTDFDKAYLRFVFPTPNNNPQP